ncbi:pyridoxal phosphate-dependent transferase [Aspergillus spectabilis]
MAGYPVEKVDTQSTAPCDVRTNPTLEMLTAMAYANLSDGVAKSDPTTHELETYIASLTSHPAALFVLSGTMGNLVALRSLLIQPPYGILCDSRAHILASKAGGMIMPLSEARRICDFAHRHGIHVHLDGARLWEVVAAGAGSLSEYCSLFDTVTMCFSKGLGAPAGAIVVGSEAVIRHARWIRQSIGGSVRQPGPLAAAALVAVQKTFGAGLLKQTHGIAQEIATFWERCGGRLKHPTRSNMVWLDFTGLSFGLREMVDEASRRGIFISRGRLVVHYQICSEAVATLKQLMADLAGTL